MWRVACLCLSLSVGLLGCAADRPAYEPPANHPANVTAAVGPMPAAVATLTHVEPVTPSPSQHLRDIVPLRDAAPMQHDMHAAPSPSPAPRDASHDHHATPATPDAMAEPHDHAAHEHDAAPAPAPAKTTYVCPMHPEVTSTDPAFRCPKCGMKLKVKAPEEAAK